MAKKIMVVDDNQEIVKVLDEFLTTKGFDVIKCLDGSEAIEVINQGKPVDLIVLDRRMSDVDGAAVMEEMDRQDKKIPVIVLKGSPTKWGLLKKAAAVVEKPINLGELLEKINGILD
jgi:DNA-binding response OmpR family regulator